MASGDEIFVNERMGAGMQRQLAPLAGFAAHAEMRHAFARVPKILDLELAQFLAPQGMEKQRRKNGAVKLPMSAPDHEALSGFRRAHRAACARLMIAEGRSFDNSCCVALRPFRRSGGSRDGVRNQIREELKPTNGRIEIIRSQHKGRRQIAAFARVLAKGLTPES